MTTKDRVMEYLRTHEGWCSGSQLEAQADDWGTKASVISRRARELAYEGRIERGLSGRKTVQYRVGVAWSAERANKFLKSIRVEQGELKI